MPTLYLIPEHMWPGLAFEYRSRQATAWRHLLDGDHAAAIALFTDAYEVLLDAQPPDHRLHKGESLHNLGLAHLWAGNTEEGLRETLAAFVEDAASLAEENPVFEELGRPAAHNLVYGFGVNGVQLAEFGRSIRAHIARGEPLPDPHAMLTTPLALALARNRIETTATRIIGRLRTAPERAVFVGGGYAHIDSHIRPMRDVVNALGYDGVVVADFDAPPDWRSDHKALSLLALCQFVVIDGSDPAGQQVEVSRLLDRQLRPDRTLVVFDTQLTDHVRLSQGMNMERLEANGIHATPYDGIEEAKAIIQRWLPT
jgi:hypothetical protein